MLQRFRTPQPSNRRASMGCLTILEHPKLVEGVWRSWKRSDVLWEAVQIQSLEGIKDGGSNPRQAKFLSGSGCDLARLCQFLSGELPRVFEFLTQNLSGEDVPFSKISQIFIRTLDQWFWWVFGGPNVADRSVIYFGRYTILVVISFTHCPFYLPFSS